MMASYMSTTLWLLMSALAFQRACLFRKWLKMVLIPFCKLLRVREGWLRKEFRSKFEGQKLPSNHKKRIKTILDQFRNTHARYFAPTNQNDDLIQGRKGIPAKVVALIEFWAILFYLNSACVL